MSQLEPWEPEISDYKDIVEEVLRGRKQFSSDRSQPLEESIRDVVKIKGFHRDPLKAPLSSLIQKISQKTSSGNLVSSIFRAWLELHNGLREKASEFLDSCTLPEAAVVAEQEETAVPSIWFSEETFNKAVKEFQNQHPDFEGKTVENMLCLLKYFKKEPPQDKPIEKEETSAALNRILRELRSLPADSPEWEPETFGEFVKNIEELREKKCREREASYKELQLALEELIKEEDALSFFEFSGVSSWKAEARSSSEAEALKEKVDALRNLLVEYLGLCRQPPPTKISEQEARAGELVAKAHKIKEIYGPLESSLATPQPSLEQSEPELPTEKQENREPVDALPIVLSPKNDTEEVQDISPQPDTEKEIPKKYVTETGSGESSPPPDNRKENQDVLDSLDVKLLQGLLPATEVAKLLKKDDCALLWHGFLWALIAEDDLPAAYWLAESLAESGKYDSPVPENLLAAIQAARWLIHDKPRFVDDMRSIVEKTEIEKTDNPVYVQMLMLAASLHSAVIAPDSGMIDWLVAPPGYPELAELVKAVKEFANLGILLQPEDLKGVAQEESREIRIKEIADKAGNWLKEAQNHKIKYRPAYNTWRALVTKNGELEKLLVPVIENRRDDVEKVKEMIRNNWRDHSIPVQIENARQMVGGRLSKPIQGKVRTHLLNRIKVGRDLASDWCRQLDGLHEIQSKGAEWRFNQVDQLRKSVQKTLPRAEEALERMDEPYQDAPLAAATFCLRGTIRQLGGALNLKTSTASSDADSYKWFADDAENLYVALSRRLLWLPELPLSDDGQPDDEERKRIARLLCDACAEERSLNASFEAWLEKQDYRFAETILDSFAEGTNKEESSHRCREKIAGSQAALRERMGEINEKIEQTLVDGIIGEERSEYSGRVVEIKPEETRNFPAKFKILEEVESDLDEARARRSEELNEIWGEKKKRLEDSHLKIEKKKGISDFISEALEKKDTRVAEEAISTLNRILDGNADPEEILSNREKLADALAEFVEKSTKIEKWLGNKTVKPIIPSIQKGLQVSVDGISFRGIPKPRRDEAAKAIERWHALKQKRPAGRDNLFQPLKVLLEYLGFEDVVLYPQERGPDWLHANAIMSASDSLIRPIPQFGSQAHGHYHIVCLWERPGAESIAARLRESRLDMGTVIVLYLGRITKGQKRDIARICREQELALAILDEILLVFLALQRDSRLPTFLNCALPLTALNPYTPFKAGDVPPEMFFGRERMVRELQNPAGSCIVYGGRQLGKSALLRHVQRQFHNPEQKKFAWIEDMKLIFDPNSGRYTNNFWRRLQNGFMRANLLKRKRATKDETIVKHIHQAMQEDNIHVLVMFDEADDFLDADAKENFEVVVKLRTLMTETERRFKVVFAGLHNVQRFQGIPNQPLAHFGLPLCVGPLEADAARQLVQKPLRTLGYRFDDTTVLRVLSYTNSHPGLIQIFCQELLRRLNRRPRKPLPPYWIEKEDIEAVYRLHKVRECIKERFDWTLALDPHYQAIAWAMIYDQIEKGDSYSEAYTSSRILELVRDWWKKGFGNMEYHQIQSLLGDLCGLGVLVRNAEGEYRLRSPNLVRLMGTGEDIENRLLGLSERELPKPFEADNYHALINTEKRNYSPLSYAQERNLMGQRFGVGLVCASEAMGFSMLNDAFKKCTDSEGGFYAQVPEDIIDGKKLKRWLKNHLQEADKGNYKCLVVCFSPPPGALSNLHDLVKSSLDFCSMRSRAEERWLRILFLFDSKATMHWLFSPHIKRVQLEDRADAVVSPRRWNSDEIHYRLDQNEKIGTEDIRESILDETGGWPMLLDELFHLCGDDKDVKPAIEALKTELQNSNSETRLKFLKSLGPEANPLAGDIWKFLLKEANPVPTELITPDMIETEHELTIEDCKNAVDYLDRVGCIVKFEDGTAIGVEPTVKRLMPSL